MPFSPRKTPARLLLLFFLLVLLTFLLFLSEYGHLWDWREREREKECRDTIHHQLNLIASLHHNLSKLQHQLNSLNPQQPHLLTSPGSPVSHARTPQNNLTPIYMITPTYSRWTQKADLTRLSHTLSLVAGLHWIVVEDSEEKTDLVTRLLRRQSHVIHSTQLNIRTMEKLRLKENEPVWRKNRGVEQRNLGLEWLRDRAVEGVLPEGGRGVVYFGDDDNTYDLQVFEEMRETRKVSVWLVGLSGGLRFEGPTCENGRVTGWYTAWGFERAFPMDMAGFAVNLSLLLSHKDAYIDPRAKRGYLETSLLEKLVTVDQLEAKGEDCTKVYVWHTRTEVPKTKNEDKLIAQGRPSNPDIET